MKIIKNKENGQILADKARLAAAFWQRLKGLLGTSTLPDGEALIITPCNSVHTFGMRYPIDVIFVGKDSQVIKTVDRMKAGRVEACLKAQYVIELPAGTLSKTLTSAGDRLEVPFGISRRS